MAVTATFQFALSCNSRIFCLDNFVRQRRLKMLENSTLAPEVTHILKHEFWLLLGNEELRVPSEQFPWFRQATINQLTHVDWPTPDHLYWPELDVDLSVQSIRHPAEFPLLSGTRGNSLKYTIPYPRAVSPTAAIAAPLLHRCGTCANPHGVASSLHGAARFRRAASCR